jgi:hypothetical protein
MADRPILFSAPMIKALLAGTKTQTRRLLNPQPNILNGGKPLNDGYGSYSVAGNKWKRYPIRASDRLWVREHWRTFISLDKVAPRDLLDDGKRGAGVLYIADGEGMALTVDGSRTYGPRDTPQAFGKHRQAMHMPRWASRLTLHVTDVRVQRLQEISEDDARAEGASYHDGRGIGHSGWRHDLKDVHADARSSYARLWNDINGTKEQPDPWSLNPWVAAYTFEVERCNIDQARAS